MNSVPALRPQYPDYGNVLARGAAIKGQEDRNVLTQMQIEDYPEDRNWLRKQRGFVEEDRAIATEDRKRALKDRLKKMKREDIEWEQKILETATSGLAKVDSVADYTAYYPYATSEKGLGLNPDLLEDPSSFIRADGTADEKAFDQYRISKVRTAKDVIKEYEAVTFPKKEKPTAMGERQALVKDGEIIAKGAKYGKAKEFKPDTDKPEVKESAARDKIAQLTRQKATFDKVGKEDVMFQAMFPEATAKAEEITDSEKAAVNDAYDSAIRYYQQFVTEDPKRQEAIAELEKQGKPVTEANIEYVMDLLNE